MISRFFSKFRDILKIEIDKLKNEIRNLNSNRQNDEAIYNQISEIQIKYAEREKKILEDKEIETKTMKKEFETSLYNLKKISNNYDKDLQKLKSENEFLKETIQHLKSEENELKGKLLFSFRI